MVMWFAGDRLDERTTYLQDLNPVAAEILFASITKFFFINNIPQNVAAYNGTADNMECYRSFSD